ncbi:hypothetical protein RTG_03351 [Rhodotorula toruloides ATCC 204091]|uniref:Phosphatidate cytidylyltransferase, mitochondrial n=1 Tax=Rhodotorula toruloides TaxID=5286 RepID=A0A0K3CN70_RHOTO|nr:hypothetical protein RTG_03351 [Rhodotorula toruloides ATCC 204091]KAK4331226.1 Phosphatidate cytidylyltransferase, mitochondrial [Rhodotorula toruloides]PRQ70558.1 Mitochondrial matrix Mmp37-domain containing protein [Rhodotorula toruloides]
MLRLAIPVRPAAAAPLARLHSPSVVRLRLTAASSPSRTFSSTRFTQLDTERQTSHAGQFPPPSVPKDPRRRILPSSASASSKPSPSPASTQPEPSAPYPSLTPQPPISPPPSTARLPRRRITSMTDLPSSFGRNQIIDVPAEVQRDLEEVMKSFKAPVRYAFAYGSGVFRQKGYAKEDKPLLDFIFAVSHPSHWHAINMQQHPEHYSLPMRLMGSNAVAWMQEKGLGAEVWFNVDVEVEGKLLKYGVISIDALCRDLLDWETLYISGRTQKPVRILHDDARVRLANQVNLASALRTALLLLPESFTEVELFEEIAGLSYRGDFRMRVGENPLKVRNIVAAQLGAFRGLYGGLLKSFWKAVHVIGEVPPPAGLGLGEGVGGIRLMRQDLAPAVRAHTASRLPVGLRDKVLGHYERKWNLEGALTGRERERREKEESGESEKGGIDLEGQRMWERIVMDDEFKEVMNRSLAQIVARPTFNQSLKGILSAGPVKSLRYVIPKLKKKWGKATSPSLPAPAPSSEVKKE